MKKFTPRFSAFLILLLLLVACGAEDDAPVTEEPTDDPGDEPAGAPDEPADEDLPGVTIGVIPALTGFGASFGVPWWEGIQMAAEEINEEGGIPGVGEITLLHEDDACDPTDAVSATNALLGGEPSLILGPICSSAALAIIPMITEDEIPLLVSTASARDITEQGSAYVFRTQLTSFRATEFLAQFAEEELGADRVAVLGETSEYGLAASSGFAENAGAHGIEVVVDENFAPEDTDFTAQLRAISQADVSVVGFFGYHPEAARFLIQAEQLGLDLTVIGTDTLFVDDLMELAGDSANDRVYATTLFVEGPDPEPELAGFIQRHEERYGEPYDTYTVVGYDSLMLAADAIERAGSPDPAAIRDALADTDGWQGLLGVTTFDEQGDDLKDPQLGIVRDGAWVRAD